MKIADNQKELLRVLTKDGTLTDTFEKRKLVHEKGLYHQEVAFIPVSRGGGILLQRRSKNKKSYPNCWALCAGHVTYKESTLEAAVKEANEELGLNLTEQDLTILVDKTCNDREDNKCYATCFYKIMDKPIEYFSKQDEEVEELKWFTIDEFKQMVLEEDSKICIFKNNEYYQKIIKSLEKVMEEFCENS